MQTFRAWHESIVRLAFDLQIQPTIDYNEKLLMRQMDIGASHLDEN